MLSIYKKEIRTFFSSLTGYIVIGVFLTILGLFMWVFPDTSLMEYDYATMDQLFSIAPLIFLFLIPAITMKSFAEEKQRGTLEFLYTKPLEGWEIIWGKFLANFTLVAIALLPTLLYYFSVYQLGSPKGNLDTGAIIGSYIGLFFLAAAFVAMGMFASAISDNQIVAFILGTLICFMVHWAFLYLANLEFWGPKLSNFIQSLGLNYHYASISKGALDTRDLVYFISVVLFFVWLTQWRVEKSRA